MVIEHLFVKLALPLLQLFGNGITVRAGGVLLNRSRAVGQNQLQLSIVERTTGTGEVCDVCIRSGCPGVFGQNLTAEGAQRSSFK